MVPQPCHLHQSFVLTLTKMAWLEAIGRYTSSRNQNLLSMLPMYNFWECIYRENLCAFMIMSRNNLPLRACVTFHIQSSAFGNSCFVQFSHVFSDCSALHRAPFCLARTQAAWHTLTGEHILMTLHSIGRASFFSLGLQLFQ